MTELDPQVVNAFSRLFPVPAVVEDWDDVLARAGRAQRRRRRPFVGRRTLAFAAGVLLAALLAAPAFGLGERLLDLIRPAPALPGSDGEYPWRSPTWSPDGRRILVSRLVAGNTLTLYVMNADATGLRILTNRTDYAAVWSPDGRSIAVVRYARGTAPPPQPETVLLYVVDADGSGGGRLLTKAFPASPAWSPDGRKIAFVRSRAGAVDVHVTNADGTGTRRLARGVRLTEDPDSDQGPLPHPAWSPDGRQIAFVSNRSGTNDLYVMDADGSGQRRLTRDSASEYAPVWSPDGRKIAFTRRAGEHWSHNDDLFVIGSDGAGLRNLTHKTPPDAFNPVWSRDGRRIFFLSEGEGGIYVVNADGSGGRNLTPNHAGVGAPDLSPDGRQILFGSGREGASSLYVMNTDGGDQRMLLELP